MMKSLAIIMGFLIGALVYGELRSNELEIESFMVDERAVLDEDEDSHPLSQENEGCDCRESEEDDCDNDDCDCECHELEIE